MTADPAVRRRRRRRRRSSVFRYWAPLLLLVALALALLWLNQSPWWGWLLVAGLLALTAAGARWWRSGPPALQGGAWTLAAVVLVATAVSAHPGPRVRTAGGQDPAPSRPVQTQQGTVVGVLNDERTVEIFAGIPYAKPPVGDLRWRAPQPPDQRSDVLRADRFSPAPIQGTTTFYTRALAQIVEVPLEGTLLNPFPVSEDSLALNVWRSTEPSSSNLPVLVYVPGGGFQTGSGALPLYDGEALASRGDIITVTISYRLGVFGFFSHPELAAESEHDASGNYGILDQIAALEWVRDNIAAFGGDPDRVTIAGQSAGGESVCILGATPLADGLVHGIIGAAGACMGTTGDTEDGDQSDSRQVAEDAGRRLSRSLGGASVDEMREMSVDRIVEAAKPLKDHWRPSVDGYVLERPPAQTYASGRQLDVPILVGSNADEASLALASPPSTDVDRYRTEMSDTYGQDASRFLELYPGDTADEVLESRLQAETDKIMTRGMFRWARLHTHTNGSHAYLYHFAYVPPENGLERFGAYHGAEVAYAYDNLGADGDAAYGETDFRLRDLMSAYWINFVRTGDPNSPGLPVWSTLEEAPEQVMGFSESSGMAPRPRPDAIDFWMSYEGPIP